MENKMEDCEKQNSDSDKKFSDACDDEMKTSSEESASSTNYNTDEADIQWQDEELEKEYKELIEKSQSQSALPDGWVQLTHESGMPVYVHTSSKVCTLAKPYAIGGDSARKHLVPEAAIPCLSYQRALKQDIQPEVTNEQEPQCHLDPAELHEYCKRVFGFQVIKVKKFASWAHRNKYDKKKKLRSNFQSEGNQLIIASVCKIDDTVTGQKTQSKYMINPRGKSYISILQEYTQGILGGIQPTYKFTSIENAKTPFAATVFVNDMQYATGYGVNKKRAKSEAAELTLEVLIPNMRSKIVSDSKIQDDDLSFLDQIKITNPQVAEYCSKIDEPLPYEILKICLRRNFKINPIQISYKENDLKSDLIEYTITVDNHTATVICKNKKDGKQQAAQAILQKLHPYVDHWGSMLRLYGNRSSKFFKSKEFDLPSILQPNEPCQHLLSTLQSKFVTLKDKKKCETENSNVQEHEDDNCYIVESETDSTLPDEGKKLPSCSNSLNTDVEF